MQFHLFGIGGGLGPRQRPILLPKIVIKTPTPIPIQKLRSSYQLLPPGSSWFCWEYSAGIRKITKSMVKSIGLKKFLIFIVWFNLIVNITIFNIFKNNWPAYFLIPSKQTIHKPQHLKYYPDLCWCYSPNPYKIFAKMQVLKTSALIHVY